MGDTGQKVLYLTFDAGYENGNICKILKILEPITLPTAMSLSPFLAAMTEVTSSGREVPTATMVRPMMASLRPKNLAISFAPSMLRMLSGWSLSIKL